MTATYQIKPGDTLSGIAKANSTDINTLLGLNPQITNPNLIISGQNLNLPQAPAPVNPNPINNATTIGAQDTGSLSTPATGLDINIPNIIDANQLKDAFNTGLTQNDISSYLAELKNREANVAKNLVPTDTEKALQTQLAGVTSGIEKAQSDLGARPGIDFFTLDRGRSEIQRVNQLTVANLQRQIGIEQATRGVALDASKFLLESAQTGFDTLIKANDAILNRATKLMDVVNTLNTQARGTFNTILTNLAGLTYDQLDTTTKNTVNRLSANLGIPLDVVKQGLQVQTDKMKNEREAQLFDQDIKKQQLAIDRQKLSLERFKATGGAGGGIDAAYLADQVLNRKIDLKGNTLSAVEKAAVLRYFSENKIPTPRALTEAEKNAQANALSGLSAVDQIDEIYRKQGSSILYKNALPGFVGRVAGASQFRTAVQEATDVKTRIRTGAALNDQEIAFYASQAPQVGDSQKDVQYKINQLRGFYLGVSGLPVKITSADGTKQAMFTDLYNPKQRLGLRQAINDGWTVQY